MGNNISHKKIKSRPKKVMVTQSCHQLTMGNFGEMTNGSAPSIPSSRMFRVTRTPFLRVNDPFHCPLTVDRSHNQNVKLKNKSKAKDISSHFPKQSETLRQFENQTITNMAKSNITLKKSKILDMYNLENEKVRGDHFFLQYSYDSEFNPSTIGTREKSKPFENSRFDYEHNLQNTFQNGYEESINSRDKTKEKKNHNSKIRNRKHSILHEDEENVYKTNENLE